MLTEEQKKMCEVLYEAMQKSMQTIQECCEAFALAARKWDEEISEEELKRLGKSFAKMCLNCGGEQTCFEGGRLIHRCQPSDFKEIKNVTSIPGWCVGWRSII